MPPANHSPHSKNPFQPSQGASALPCSTRSRAQENGRCTPLLLEGQRAVPGGRVVPGEPGRLEGKVTACAAGLSGTGPGTCLQGSGHAAVFGRRHPRPCRGLHGFRRNHLRTSTAITGVAAHSPAKVAGWGGLSCGVSSLAGAQPAPTDSWGLNRLPRKPRLKNRGGAEEQEL